MHPTTVFVVSPIGTPGTTEAVNASHALEYIIRQALPKPEWNVIRADEEKDPGSITHRVIDRIVNSDLIVADLTDCNPNVFYELAVAHGYKKPVVTIMTSGQKVPFDIIDMRTVFYDLTNPASVHSAKERLRDSAREVLTNPTQTNPLVSYEMFSTASNAVDASPDDKLEFAMGQVLARLGHIERRLGAVDSIDAVHSGSSSDFASLADASLRSVLGLRRGDDIRHGLARVELQLAELDDRESATGSTYPARRGELEAEQVLLLDQANRAGVKWVSTR